MTTLNVVLLVVTFLAYLASYINPERAWWAGFMALAIPITLVLNVIFALYWLVTRPLRALYSVAVLLLGYRFIQATIAFSPQDEDAPPPDFTVMTYNVRAFNLYHSASSEEMIRWVSQTRADIVCLQEFYNQNGSDKFSAIARISHGPLNHYYFSPWVTTKRKGQFGMAIFSTHPIIYQGTLELSKATNNQIIYADIRLPKGMVRVYNIHLQSMRISAEELNLDVSEEEMRKHASSVTDKLRGGFEERGRQMRALEESIKTSPYPVLVCGDLNDLPYSHTYYRLNNELQNAFEKAGHGLGVSYAGNLPFLRIDNQFADQRFNVVGYETFYNAIWSDHYPVKAAYTFKSAREN
ncbi:Metal-dependent hydrolase, endonuclease/exonuclease/phosphatase family [Catalinimonas alkaloidigena]|uniref:Metal-dependent hydrolase, endonuclease/exonuclease/phosphatase family n=1 Tax=Catalinimonas alkaloidigena TaxID=1075417 RepID=A0A1G9F0I6_9BACT|nr:endonuclease/exonuclease/phosphatase family protein [Catalinimonas alkaloidigena]SDK81966.1 Metal-dependent hydrolase, endonuclease/exonuclease/phosphatase family [Catalinimonas alkaloidigena]